MRYLLLSMLMVSINASADACLGNRGLCPVLRDVPITIHVVGTNMHKRCGRKVTACSKHYKNRCEIYIPRFQPIGTVPLSNSERRKLIVHETNHCRGWDHPVEGKPEWYPMAYPEGW